MSDSEDFDALFSACSTFIELREEDERLPYNQEVAGAARKFTENFFDQFYKKIEMCKNEEDKEFVIHTTGTFLMHSFLRIIQETRGMLHPGFEEEIINHIASRLKKR
jgi:hypothetical protein